MRARVVAQIGAADAIAFDRGDFEMAERGERHREEADPRVEIDDFAGVRHGLDHGVDQRREQEAVALKKRPGVPGERAFAAPDRRSAPTAGRSRSG